MRPGRRAGTTAALAGLAFAGAAYAQQGAPVIYGRLYPQIATIAITGATARGSDVATIVAPPAGGGAQRRTELQASNSRLGLRGEEPLAGETSVIWQVEQQIGVDAGGAELASRDTFVGLRGPLGTLRAGLLDTVYKTIGDAQGFLGIGSGNFVSDSDVLSKCGLGPGSACSFHLRRGNSLRYDSASWHSVEVMLQLSPDERRSSTRDAWLASAGLAWTHGPFYAAVGWERHNDFFGGSRSGNPALSNADNPAARSRDTGVRASVRYASGRHDVEIELARLVYRESGGADGHFASYEHDHAAVGWRVALGGGVAAQANYVYASPGTCTLAGGAPCSTAGLGAHQLSLGARYDLSRRTQLYAIGSALRNGASSRFSNLESGAPSTGADTRQLALGIVTRF